MTKYELIDSIAVQVDALIDMRGVEKCKNTLDIIGKLNALRSGLAEDEKANTQRIEALERRISELTPAEDEDTETIGGRTYRIGETAGSREER